MSSSTGTSMPTSLSAQLPADGIKGLRENWKGDLVAGLLVSLIALPLCLGIAMASGFPAFGGVITAIIGGVLVGPLSGAPLTIKGPAAGLIAIVIASVEALGQGNALDGYRFTLAVIVVASLVQIGFAVFKLGRFADFFPASVIHGMLAAIGIIIIAKQVHPLLGVKPIARDAVPLLLEIPHSLVVMNPEIALVGVSSVLIVLFATNIFGRVARFFPGPLVAVCAGIGFCLYFDFTHAHKYQWYSIDYSIDERFLVSLPESFFSGVTFPDFSKILSVDSVEFILLFALIGSLESLLTCKAVDALDPARRKARLDKDLLAVGCGNLLCGLIGGLPMIAEVVRSSANIHYGARTRWANFFHGTCLLILVVLLTPVIKLVPNAALAGVLCVIGYRLASPRHFRQCRKIGKEQLFVFIVTIVATLLTDLLLGVVVGMCTEYLVAIFNGAPALRLFSSIRRGDEQLNGRQYVQLPEACTFGNVIGFKRALVCSRDPPYTLDFSGTIYIDHTFMHELRNLERDCDVKLIGLDRLTPVSPHREAMRRMLPSDMNPLVAKS